LLWFDYKKINLGIFFPTLVFFANWKCFLGTMKESIEGESRDERVKPGLKGKNKTGRRDLGFR